MGKNLRLFLLLVLAIPMSDLNFAANPINQQNRNNNQEKESRISGRVIDANTKEPIEYANVILFRKIDSTYVAKSFSNKDGIFIIENTLSGKYFISISCIGYKSARIDSININGNTRQYQVGQVALDVDLKTLDDILVQAKSGRAINKIDKTVVRVGDMPQAEGGTAVDVLRKLPSISQTPNGQITIHGDPNFLLLINGKPTSLQANEMLHYIPAGEIAKIELIDSPTAKYDASGSGGIINIITKNAFGTGISGNVNLSADQLSGFSSDLLLNFNNKKVNFFVGIDHSDRKTRGDIERWTNNFDYNNLFYQYGRQAALRSNNGFRSGFDVSLNDNNKMSFGGNIGNYVIKNSGDWDATLTSNIIETSTVTDRQKRDGEYGGTDFSYHHYFNDKNHYVSFSGLWNFNSYDDSFINMINQVGNNKEQNTILDKRFDEYQINVDYVNPIGEYGKFELGYQYGYDKQFENFRSEVTIANATNSSSSTNDFKRSIHGIYSVFGQEFNKFQWEIGLRGEYFDRDLLASTNELFNKKHWDFYPSLHTSWNIDSTQQLIFSYNRRTNKLSAARLDPLPRWYEYYMVRVGNPMLDNEISDRLSLKYNQQFNALSLNTDLYYSITSNLIEGIRSVYDNQIVQQKYENIGSDKTMGIELNAEYSLTKWWSLSENVDFYFSRITIDNPITVAKKEYNQFSSFTTNSFKISPTTYFEAELSYFGPSKYSQLEYDKYLMIGMTFRQQFFKKKLSFSATGTDIFGMYKSIETIKGDGFDQRVVTKAVLPIRFSLTYKFKDFKRDEKRTVKVPPAE